MFDISIEKTFDFLSDEYRALFAISSATAFQSPLWLDRLYRRLAPRLEVDPLVIAARWSSTGRLAIILPLVRRRHGALRVIEFADLQVSDYASPVCEEAVFAQIAASRKACEDIRRALKPFDLLRIRKVGESALPLEQLLGVSPRSSMGMSAHAVRLHGPYEQWRAQNIDASYRKELDKKQRQLGRKGAVQFACSRDPEVIKSTFYTMRQFRQERFQGRDLLQKSLYFDFYLEVALQGAEDGFSRTYTLAIDGHPIGGVWGLHHRHQFLVLLGGFDLAAFKNQSIGALTFSEIARDCIERGDTLLDFTIGDESYKRLFGAQPSRMWMISAAGTPLGRIANFVAEKVPWTMKLAKQVVNRRREASAAP